MVFVLICLCLSVTCLNPNLSLNRLSNILGCFHPFLFIFRLFVGILLVLFYRRSPLHLQEEDKQYAQQPNKICTGYNGRLGLKKQPLFLHFDLEWYNRGITCARRIKKKICLRHRSYHVYYQPPTSLAHFCAKFFIPI